MVLIFPSYFKYNTVTKHSYELAESGYLLWFDFTRKKKEREEKYLEYVVALCSGGGGGQIF